MRELKYYVGKAWVRGNTCVRRSPMVALVMVVLVGGEMEESASTCLIAGPFCGKWCKSKRVGGIVL